MNPQDVLQFWFHEIDSKYWFMKDDKFDQQLRDRFMPTYQEVLSERTSHWRTTAEGRLAEIIVLDQFSRNMFRGKPKAFAGDHLALKLAKEAIALGEDKKLSVEQRAFMYMPFMHSEDPSDHETAMKLFSLPGLESNLEYEIMHKKIIDRFGRYPHRNQVLGRESTPEEIAFLKEPGSSF